MRYIIKSITIFLCLTVLIIGCGQKENKNLVNAKNLIAGGNYQEAKEEIQLAKSAEAQNPEILSIAEILKTRDKESSTDWRATIDKVLGYVDPINGEIKRLQDLDKEVGLDDDDLELLETLIRQRNSSMGFLARSIADASQKDEPWTQELMNNSADLLVSAMLEAGKSFEPASCESVEHIILKMDVQAVYPLISELKDSDADIRKQAVLFLGKLRADKAVASMSELLQNQMEDSSVIYNTVVALEMIGGDQIIDSLILALKTKSAQARMHAAILLGQLKAQVAIPSLITLLADNNTYVQTNVINILAHYGQLAVEPLLEVLSQEAKNIIPDEPVDTIKETYIANAYIDEDQEDARRISVQKAAITALGKIKTTEAIKPLIKLLDNEDLEASVVSALTTMNSVAVDALINTIEGELLSRDQKISENMRENAVLILGNVNDLRAAETLISALNDTNRDVRANAVEALGKMKVRGENLRVVKALGEILANPPDDKTKHNAVVALGNIAQYEEKSASELIKIASDPAERENLRQAAITALVAIKPKEATDAMIKIMLNDEESDVLRKSAVTVLGEIKPEKAMPPMLWILSKHYDDPKDFLRQLKRKYRTVEDLNTAIEQLGVDWQPNYNNLIEVKPIPSLVRSEVAVAFGKIKNTFAEYDVVEPLIKALEDDQRAVVRQKAAWAVGEIVNPQDKIVPALEDAIRDDDLGIVRSEAATAMGKIKGKNVVAPLVDTLREDEYETARKNAAVALDEVVFENAAEGLVAVLKNQVGKEEEERETEAVLDAVVASLIKEGEAVANKPMVSEVLLGENVLKVKDEIIRKRAFHAFGSIAEPSKMDVMVSGLEDESVIVRERAAALLDNFKQRKAVEPLIEVLNDAEKSNTERAKAAASLGGLRDERALQTLLDALKDGSSQIRASASAALGNLKDIRAVEPLIEIVNNPSPSEYVFSITGELYSPVRNNSIAALGKIGDSRAEPTLIKIVQNENETVIPRRTAITALGNLASKQAVPMLIEILQDQKADQTSRINAATALGKIEDERAAKPLEERLLDKTEYNITMVKTVKHNKFWEAVANAVSSSFTISPAGTDELISRLTDTWEHDPIRIAAAKALGRTGTDKAIEQLKDTFANDSVEGVRQAAGLALGKTKREDLVPLLVDVMKDTSKAAGDRRGATQGLGEIADPSTVDDLAEIIHDASVGINIRRDSAISLGKIGSDAAVEELIEELGKEGIDRNLKWDIISALGTAKSDAAVKKLESMLKDEDADVHFTAADYLFQITGDGYGYKRAGG